MASKTFCDICSKTFPDDIFEKFDRLIYVGGISGDRRDYCINCWEDKENWKRIHRVTPKKAAQ